VLSAYGPVLGLDETMCKRVAAGFGGGLGAMQEACGAVTGAVMVLGLKYGVSGKDLESRYLIYEKVQEFGREFKARNKFIACRDLLDFDISTKSGMKEAREKGIFKAKCPGFVRDAADILDKML
jgi:C_GCAxxG_C_C family probable redox protein